MSARPPLVWLAAVLAMAVWSCAPAPGIPPSSTTTEAAVTTVPIVEEPAGEARELVVGIGDHGAPRTLNPFLDGPDTAILDLMAPAWSASGYDIDPGTREPVADVLEAIPTLANGGLVVNPDGTMDVTVRVDPAARWADGIEITADDLAFTVATVLDPDLPIRSDLRNRYSKIVPGSVQASGRELTFQMDIDPSVELLFDLIIPAHAVRGSDFAADWNETAWVSGGPFELEAYQQGQYLALQRNEDYWKVDASSGERLPLFDRIVFRFFEPSDTPDPRLLRAFQVQDLDLAIMAFPSEVAAEYADLEPEGAVIVSAAGTAWQQINFQFGPANRNGESLNRYLRYRQAVAHAIDRTALAGEQGATPLYSVLRAYLPDLGEDPWTRYGFDPEETAGLLYSLGTGIGQDLFAGGGPRLVITTSSDGAATVTMAGEIVVMLNEAGIGAELQLEDPELFFGPTLDNGTWDAAVWRFEGNPGRSGAVDFIDLFDPEGLPFVGNNYFRWGTVDSVVSNPATRRYAEIVDEIHATIDPDEIDRLLIEAEGLLASQVVLIPLVIGEQSGAVFWSGRLEGVAANPAGTELWNIETWRPPEG